SEEPSPRPNARFIRRFVPSSTLSATYISRKDARTDDCQTLLQTLSWIMNALRPRKSKFRKIAIHLRARRPPTRRLAGVIGPSSRRSVRRTPRDALDYADQPPV